MQTFSCRCANPLFFENTVCLSCEAEVGWCPSCDAIVALEPLEQGGYRCARSECGALLEKCRNYAVENVCNRMVPLEQGVDALCDCCRHNAVIPDLSIEGNRERWAALEAAKRRLFYTLDLLKLPHAAPEDGAALPLSFSFMADALPDQGLWRSVGQQKVYTGHAAGHITINVKEADTVERERLRVDMNESHRTLIGHFRHEVGHYYWDLLVKDQDEAACKAVFGDHENPTYGEALEQYYQQGAPLDWAKRHISAYATMHAWEDFAETFAFYLDMVAVLDTALHMGISRAEYDGTLDGMLAAYHQVGLAVNELNRDMGLLDLAPAVLAAPVRDKLDYLHTLIAHAAHQGDEAPQSPSSSTPKP
ncbi:MULTISPECIES: putative zinc-binding metallopeptidase [unclassified Halomonas]|uniref:zinc-binding metallopeptidase family protein n=1 Tax=unclassified Halomonas TaxID=2609666 RepID=UPI00209F57A1|nr:MULTISPECIES: putative zinc-binding metallopeptidase [unclassified Halomonas]MCP1312928.1 putative zinc-binding peptidase [Halomonas sp. 707D7]MCP1325974.1 putative zinc-binding peptidase [Halomonas sp. 707D4]